MNDASPVVLIGAYERDNFGDLLFLLLTRQYLARTEWIASAPFNAATAELLGHDVHRYSDAVASENCRAVWTVGGEVGGVSLEYAFRMAASEADHELWTRLNQSDKRTFLSMRSGLWPTSAPYMPRMSASEATMGSTLILNSVGVRGVGSLSGSFRREAETALREASFISVRDTTSSQLLRKLGIEHLLAPDLVHTMKLSHPQETRGPAYSLVQVREKDLQDFGVEAFARQLCTSSAFRGSEIRLFSAGIARQHDSVGLYKEVIDTCARMRPAIRVVLSGAKTPLEKVSEIAGARLWVGTSLHGHIVAATYDVPRVGLDLLKVTRYAQTWSDDSPVGVPIGQMGQAASEALSMLTKLKASGRSMDLAQSAHRSVLQVRQTSAKGP